MGPSVRRLVLVLARSWCRWWDGEIAIQHEQRGRVGSRRRWFGGNLVVLVSLHPRSERGQWLPERRKWVVARDDADGHVSDRISTWFRSVGSSSLKEVVWRMGDVVWREREGGAMAVQRGCSWKAVVFGATEVLRENGLRASSTRLQTWLGRLEVYWARAWAWAWVLVLKYLYVIFSIYFVSNCALLLFFTLEI